MLTLLDWRGTSRRAKVVVASDFNVKSEKWFASCTDGNRALSEFATANGLIVMNNSIDSTHFHRGLGSFIDVTFASESPACSRSKAEQYQKGSQGVIIILYHEKAGNGRCT